MNSTTAPESVSLSARVSTRFAPPQLQTLEQWQVIRHLGSGSTAHVWLMQHGSSTQYAACKTPKTDQDASILSQEAEIAASLLHENLVEYFDPLSIGASQLSCTEATWWEYFPTGSLADLVAARGKLTVAETVTVLLPMLQVVEYLHSQQIVHGDISPRNILFDLTGRPVLIDLGAARATAHTYTLTGTPGFLAPELNTMRRQVDGLGSAADVYSLAAVGWFCLTGIVPGPPHSRVPLVSLNDAFEQDIVDVLEAALSEEPALRPSLKQLLYTVPYWAEPEPVDMYAAAGEEYELLLPTRKPKTPQKRTRRRSWRNRKPRTRKAFPTSSQFDDHTIPRRRMWLGLSAGLLVLGVLGTVAYGPESPEHYAEAEHIGPEAPRVEQTDWQAVADTLAKERTAAWVDTDASLVDGYAIAESEIYKQDTVVLESLAAAEHTLEGLRMRAVVAVVEPTDNGALITVEWRMDEYIQRDASGKMVDEFEARTDELLLTLELTADGWKIANAAAG